MKKITPIVFFLILVTYQNCSAPIQDLTANNSTEVDCPESTRQASINDPVVNGTNYRFDIFFDEEADSVRWSIPPIVSSRQTPEMTLSEQITTPGDYLIQAIGYKTNCDIPLFTATKNFTVSSGGGPVCNSTFTVTVTPNPVVVGNAVTVTMNNANLFTTNTIRWQINGNAYADADNRSTFTYTPSTSGTLIVTANATALCGSNRNASANLVVNQNTTAAATLVEFDAKPYFTGVTAPIRGQPNTPSAVYKIGRPIGKKLSIKYANFQSVQTDLVASTGTNCSFPSGSGNLCYDFDIITPVGACATGQRLVTATGTNGQTLANTFFIYCPSNQTFCHVGLLENRLPGEVCSSCGINQYLPSGATTCQSVGNGYYSPGGTNERSVCTNTIPANAVYSGPGANGQNMCPWTCGSGFQQQGNSCVAVSVTCPAIPSFSGPGSSCTMPASPQGNTQGGCVSNTGMTCGNNSHGICQPNGQWTQLQCECGCL
jgi:hypothetical protein